MFFLEGPAKRGTDNPDAFEVTVPTYRSQEFRKGDRVAVIEAGSAAITIGKVVGVKVSDTPSPDPDDLRGEDVSPSGTWLYASGDLGDRLQVVLEQHEGTHDILPHFVMAVAEPMDRD